MMRGSEHDVLEQLGAGRHLTPPLAEILEKAKREKRKHAIRVSVTWTCSVLIALSGIGLAVATTSRDSRAVPGGVSATDGSSPHGTRGSIPSPPAVPSRPGQSLGPVQHIFNGTSDRIWVVFSNGHRGAVEPGKYTSLSGCDRFLPVTIVNDRGRVLRTFSGTCGEDVWVIGH